MSPKVELRFRRYLYLTLGAACLGLGYAEFPFLTGMTAFTGIVLILMLIAYRLEGRWTLSLGWANFLGGLIAMGAVAWVYYQYNQPAGSVINQLPWPTMLLPFLGPLLMILIPAKLFRPKNVGDFWSMQLIGLMAVALASSMTDDPIFGVIMFIYLVFAFASLTLFYSLREGDPSAMPRLGLRSLVGSVSLAAFALALFLATPRLGDARWELGMVAAQFQTGIQEDRPAIDLNQSGTLRVNGDLAFDVSAVHADGSPKLDVMPTQRWRVTTFNYYWRGKWDTRPWRRSDEIGNMAMNRPMRGLRSPARPVEDSAKVLPKLGPDQFFFTFRLPAKAPLSPILADPIWAGPVAHGPIHFGPAVTLGENGLAYPWLMLAEGDAIPPETTSPGGRYTYRQVTAPLDDPRISPSVNAEKSLAEHLSILQELPHLRRWTHNVVGLLVNHGKLPPEVYREDDLEFRADPIYHEQIARALEDYLSVSGDFRYSLILTRRDTKIDPVEDFVMHTRRGHCNRFATALALMCRTQGVPTRIVLGYIGAESIGDGNYAVRQNHAHSWVEALIQRPVPGGLSQWHWLTLDASPFAEVPEDSEYRLGRWLEDVQRGTTRLFKSFIIDYDADTQTATRLALGQFSGANVMNKFVGAMQWLITDAAAAALLLIALILCLIELRRRRLAPKLAGSPVQRRLLALANKMGIPQRPSRTLQETAGEMANAIRIGPAMALANVPFDVVNQLYDARFGNGKMTPAIEASLGERLNQVDKQYAW